MRLLIAIALIAAPVSAMAGIRATYIDPDQQRLVIEVSDSGDIRIDGPDPSHYGIIKGEQFYVVGREGDGWTVARIEDVANAIGAVSPPLLRELFGAGSARAKPASLRVVEKGKRTHLGREGLLLSVHHGGGGRPSEPTMFLVSRDEDLKPVGRALEQFSLAFIVMLGGLTGPTPSEEIEGMRSLFALGTPLEIEDGYKLVALETAAIPAERATLPAKPRTLQEIIAATKLRPLTEEEMAEPGSALRN